MLTAHAHIFSLILHYKVHMYYMLIHQKISKLNMYSIGIIIFLNIQHVKQHYLCFEAKTTDKLYLPFSLRHPIRSSCFISISFYFLILCPEITFLIKSKLNNNSLQAKIHIHINKHDLYYNQISCHFQSKKMRMKGFPHLDNI